MAVDDLRQVRSVDPGRGPFRAVTKQGAPLNAPPKKRKVNVLHPNKTAQDYLPVKERQRYKDWLKRQGR